MWKICNTTVFSWKFNLDITGEKTSDLLWQMYTLLTVTRTRGVSNFELTSPIVDRTEFPRSVFGSLDFRIHLSLVHGDLSNTITPISYARARDVHINSYSDIWKIRTRTRRLFICRFWFSSTHTDKTRVAPRLIKRECSYITLCVDLT